MAGGLLAHRLKFAHTGGLAALAALILGLQSQGRERKLALGTAALGAFAVIAFPYARAATLALLACVPIALVLSLRQRRWAVLLGGAALLVGAGVVALRPSARERFLSSVTAQGSGDRSFLLEAGANAVRSAPFTGVGAGRFKVRDFAAPGTPRYVLENTGKAHNQLLSIAAESGLPGLLLFCLALAALALRMRPVTPARAVGLTALAHFLLLSAAHDPLYQAPFSMALALALSFGTSQARPMPGSASVLERNPHETRNAPAGVPDPDPHLLLARD
jgi:O-antigen ligase